MGRREYLNRHFPIRHTYMDPPRKNNRRMLLFTLGMVVAVSAIFKIIAPKPAAPAPSAALPNSAPAVSAAPVPEYSPNKLVRIVDSLCVGNWGLEIQDEIHLLLGAWGDLEDKKAAVSYLTLLSEGASPIDADEALLRQLAVFLGEAASAENASNETLDRYRQAMVGARGGILYGGVAQSPEASGATESTVS